VDDDEVMLITDGGKVLRCPVSGISTMGRATQGVRVMDLAPNENLVSIARLAESDEVAPDSDATPAGEAASSDSTAQGDDSGDDGGDAEDAPDGEA